MALLQMNYLSKVMKRTVTLNALLPMDTLVLPWQKPPKTGDFKSLYLLHGFFGNYTDWLSGTKIQEYSNQYQVAIFMPSGDNSFYIDDADKGEYFGEFVGSELVDFTRRMFPLAENRESTWIGGLSMGGYGAIRNGLKYAHNFSRIIALSSALITYGIPDLPADFTSPIADYRYFSRVFGDLSQLAGSDKDPESLLIQLKENNVAIPKVYMACGTEDTLIHDNRRYRDFLSAEHVDLTYEEGPGDHDWDFWNTGIERAIQWALSE